MPALPSVVLLHGWLLVVAGSGHVEQDHGVVVPVPCNLLASVIEGISSPGRSTPDAMASASAAASASIRAGSIMGGPYPGN
jgi:hypothetical protein